MELEWWRLVLALMGMWVLGRNWPEGWYLLNLLRWLRRRRGRAQERARGKACMKCLEPLPWDSAFAICRPCREDLAVTQPQSSPTSPRATPAAEETQRG